MGNGLTTLFWYDQWLGPAPLKVQFPRLFLLEFDKLGAMAAHGFWDGLNWAWNFAWARPLRSRDAQEKDGLLSLLNQVCLAPDSKDALIWTFIKSRTFSTKSLTLKISKANLPPHIDAIKGIWKGLVPHRIEVFVWTSLLGRINTRSKLLSMGIILQSCTFASSATHPRKITTTSCFIALSHIKFGMGGLTYGTPNGLNLQV